MNKHIVKHIVRLKLQDLVGLVVLMPLGALYPSKSGLMNKHIVKHTGICLLSVCAWMLLMRGLKEDESVQSV